MFEIKSYILIPGKKITSLDLVKNNPFHYFDEITNIEKYNVEDFDFNYLDGSINLKYYDEILMDFVLWDLVDQVWAYFLNIFQDVVSTGYGKSYFPDMPLLIEIKTISDKLILFEIEKHTKYALPTYEFMKEMLSAGEYFFKILSKYNKLDYNHEFNQISNLKGVIEKLK
ncbi:hypothetical protein [Chengkuizengella sediminis]|uniref:hypothetical protein n=1 Tax=Chengkuizengella sediminis TaxID=1885917 RepID=UPI001389671C|nr:hypothetical protein [Chengkuizengella sediminis]NDI36661.1 hypothetical protein [Chengkuizengella sediminis]